MLDALDGVDIVHAMTGAHAVTLGDVGGADGATPTAVELTCADDLGSQQAVDHVVRVGGRGMAAGRRKKDGEDWVKQARVEKLLTPGQPFSQLSDHYGVMVDLRNEAAMRSSRASGPKE